MSAMLALWLEEKKLAVREVPAPDPVRGEALVRVLIAGICNTDIELTRGYYPFAGIPGHEFVGIVEEGPGALMGKRVVGEIGSRQLVLDAAIVAEGAPGQAEELGASG